MRMPAIALALLVLMSAAVFAQSPNTTLTDADYRAYLARLESRIEKLEQQVQAISQPTRMPSKSAVTTSVPIVVEQPTAAPITYSYPIYSTPYSTPMQSFGGNCSNGQCSPSYSGSTRYGGTTWRVIRR